MIEEKKYFIVDEEEEDLRLDVFISSALSDLSRTYIQSLIKDKKVTVNDKIEKSSYKVAQLDN
ncbi:MAG: RNA pseudouridine synthase, partial [Acetoanaerobium sp.]|nr:RNA pseudouridine synthase [Acetoanaerobium sp.]